MSKTAGAGLGVTPGAGGRSGGKTPVGGPRVGSSMGSSREIEQLNAQISEMSAHLEGLEKERDFYFSKVRL
jgi:RP/EB family microtubule-associated protein